MLERYDPQTLRFFMLQAHYRSPLNFSAEMMDAAQRGLERILTAARNLRFLMERRDNDKAPGENAVAGPVSDFVRSFEEAMEDDLNTANAISSVFDLVKYINANSNAGQTAETLGALYDTLERFCGILGIDLDQTEAGDAEIEALIARREAARKDKDYGTADAIRDELTAKGIILEDSREGVKWRRKKD